ncbi:hypothetical protein HYW20_07050 [Candidatus Woesearchaeota archaeon]|nr:hypothetical protein [Candidatus Woesearchaeota archaeon]
MENHLLDFILSMINPISAPKIIKGKNVNKNVHNAYTSINNKNTSIFLQSTSPPRVPHTSLPSMIEGISVNIIPTPNESITDISSPIINPFFQYDTYFKNIANAKISKNI